MRAGCLGAALAAAAAALLLLLPGAEALGTQRKARARPKRDLHRPRVDRLTSLVVHVQRDFFEGLIEPPEGARLERLGTLDQANFSMDALYREPVCTGRGWFVEKGRAPAGFCRHKNGRVDESIEGRWHPEFDEYALEKIMLGKWLESPARCVQEGTFCEDNADLVVVPSPYMSVAMQLGWKWKNIWSLNDESFMTYWELVRNRYYNPEKKGPLVVVHIPYCWAKSGLLKALMKQPKGFASRVVVAGIESNLQTPERALFGKEWTGGSLAQLRARAQQRLNAAEPSGEPLLFALPYPTSVLHTVNFAKDDGQARYIANMSRRVNVSFTGNLSKSSDKNWVRTLVHNKISDMGGEPTSMMVNSSILCPSYKSWRPNCGLGLAMSMWDVAADSTFCLEPPGDTPTRSHFYIALQSGCVPVLFNGGHLAYEENEPAWFAWRKAPTVPGETPMLPGAIEDLFKDANKMAVVFNSTDVMNDKVDVMRELLDMPTKYPRRLWNLRRQVDNAAPLMTFSKEAPGLWLPSCARASNLPAPKPADAFEAFQGIMLWEATQQKAPGSTPSWCSDE